MNIIPIASLDDPRIALYRNLKDREIATQGDRFIAEGELIVGRLLDSGLAVESVLAEEGRIERLAGKLKAGTTIYVTPGGMLSAVVGYKFHLGMLALGVRPARRSILEMKALMPEGKKFTLVVGPDILNHDNLGALLRISAGLGADAMLLGERSCDPYWRRSIRVSMGAIFRLPVFCSTDILRDLRLLRTELEMELLATVLDDKAIPLWEVKRKQRTAILVGNEAQGLPRCVTDLADAKITIPMQWQTDSLNVAIATAICLYALAGNQGQP